MICKICGKEIGKHEIVISFGLINPITIHWNCWKLI